MNITDKPKNKDYYNLVIGIDPDTDKSGVATYSALNGLDLRNYDFINLLAFLKFFKSLDSNVYKVLIRLEAGHLIKSTWHKGGNAMAKKVGANHEIGRQIEKACIYYGLDYELVVPFGGSNIDHKTFNKITGMDFKSTNPETRVAGLLAYNYFKK